MDTMDNIAGTCLLCRRGTGPLCAECEDWVNEQAKLDIAVRRFAAGEQVLPVPIPDLAG